MSEDDLNLGEEQKSSKTRWIIIGGVLAVILIIVGTLYGMGMFSSDDSGEETTEVSKSSESSESLGSSDSSESIESDEPDNSIYYPLSPFTVNFRQGDGTKLMQISMTALVQSQEVATVMEKHDPVIRNNLLLLLGGQEPTILRTREGKEGLRKLVLKEMQTILEKRTGNKGIEDIFFTGFVMQ